jgi:hypothetical protein
MRRLLLLLATLAIAALALASATGASAADSSTASGSNFHTTIATGFDYGQGECCLFWYFGTPTAVTLPKVGPATLTTFFIQCFATFLCDPQNSQLTMTFETRKGDKLVLLGYAPNLGTSTSDGNTFELSVDGTWTTQPESAGRFASYVGSGTFSFVLTQQSGAVGGSEQIALTGSLASK